VPVTTILKTLSRSAKQLSLFAGLGALCGAGVGFFIFLRLGFPAQPLNAGYISGLFLLSGVKLGVLVWVGRMVVRFFQPAEVADMKKDEPEVEPWPTNHGYDERGIL